MYHTVSLVHTTPDAEKLIAYMARVSNPDNQDNPESERLIKYLIKHKHWSPFEMVNMCVEIETTRSVAAQILRHRSFSFQEFSQRYAKVAQPAQLPQLRRQDTKNRQNSVGGAAAPHITGNVHGGAPTHPVGLRPPCPTEGAMLVFSAQSMIYQPGSDNVTSCPTYNESACPRYDEKKIEFGKHKSDGPSVGLAEARTTVGRSIGQSVRRSGSRLGGRSVGRSGGRWGGGVE